MIFVIFFFFFGLWPPLEVGTFPKKKCQKSAKNAAETSNWGVPLKFFINTSRWVEAVEKNKKSMAKIFFGENFSIFRDIFGPKLVYIALKRRQNGRA